MPISQMWELRPRLVKPLAQNPRSQSLQGSPHLPASSPCLSPIPAHTPDWLLFGANTNCPAPSHQPLLWVLFILEGSALTLPMAAFSLAQTSRP